MPTEQEITRTVTLRGLTDIMFDRYPGNNETQLEPYQKMYFGPDAESLVIPAENISSLLSAQNTPSAPKRFLDSRKYKAVAQGILSYTTIAPILIPLMRQGKQIVFHGFDGGVDKKAGIYIDHRVARLDKGIPNPKVRPIVQLPWDITFLLSMYPNDDFNETLLQNLIVKAGIGIGLGTYRGKFGKFAVEKWE